MKRNQVLQWSTGLRRAGISRLWLGLSLALAVGGAHAQMSDAHARLKAMTDYVSSQKTIELKFDSDIEVVTPLLEKIQFASSGEVLLSRPDKLRASRVGGHADVALVFDGQTASVLGRNINAYTQFAAPGTVDQLFAALRAGHAVALPGADLLLSNAYEVLAADIKQAKVIGRGVIDGVECDHLAFRNFDTDWQLWVQVGSQPIPRKMVITGKTINSGPQYTLRIKSWKTGFKPAGDAFAFKPPVGATQIAPERLIDLDELPQGSSTGELQ